MQTSVEVREMSTLDLVTIEICKKLLKW
jgi:hypothetical protein